MSKETMKEEEHDMKKNRNKIHLVTNKRYSFDSYEIFAKLRDYDGAQRLPSRKQLFSRSDSTKDANAEVFKIVDA